MNINEVNNLDENVFFEIFKNIFEHSDFITHEVESLSPFQNKLDVIYSFIKVFDALAMNVKITLIKSLT